MSEESVRGFDKKAYNKAYEVLRNKKRTAARRAAAQKAIDEIPEEFKRPIIRRPEARAAGLIRYFNGKPCPKGHYAERYTVCGGCCACSPEKLRKRRSEKREECRQWHREWCRKNPDKVREKTKRMLAKHGDKIRAANRAYYASRPEYGRMKAAAYNAAKRSATPKWLTSEQREQIAEIYRQAHAISQETGIPHDVDHVVPVLGRSVCGLHVPWNLQVLPASVNRGKGNSHEGIRRSHRWDLRSDRG